MQELMPHYRFERSDSTYRDEVGHTLHRDEFFVHVTQRGGKDGFTKIAQEWIDSLREKASSRSDFDPNAVMYIQWHEKASKDFEAFKSGLDPSDDGLSLKDLLSFSSAEVKNCQSVGINTLEQLSQATEIAMGMMGPGARAMKLKAQKMLEDYESGKAAEENAALHVRIDEQSEEIARLRKLIESSSLPSAPIPPIDIAAIVREQLAAALADMPAQRGPNRPRNVA